MKKTYLICCFLVSALGFAQTSGTLIVLNKSDDTVNFINLKTDSIVATIPTGKNPHEVAISLDGKTAVVTNYGNAKERGNSLTIIDIPERKVTKTIKLDYFAPHGIVMISNEDVLVTSEMNKKVLVVNIPLGYVTQEVNTGQEISHMVAYAGEVNKAFVANIGSGSVSVIDLNNYRLEKIIPTGNGAEGIAVSPDNQSVWVTNRAADFVSVIDIESFDIVDLIESLKFPIRVKFTHQSNLALVSNAQTGTVNVFDARTDELLHTISMEATATEKEPGRLFQQFEDSPVPVGILIHPNDKYAYVANTNADVITVINLETFAVEKRLKAGREPDGLGFTQITF
ncbi:MAG: YncE family protein [Flavobacteriaceae bacterium]|nr:YncE family protein [Flavobacteriaceae bacterium]